MLQLLIPSMLFALLGLIVPIAIHLYNRKSGKRIKIGSVALLQESQSKQMRSIQFNELTLLLIRCLLLILLVMLISQPQWATKKTTAPAGWILISPEIVAQVNTDKSLQETIDSLQQKGFDLHAFIQGFPPLTPDEKKTVAYTGKNESYWSLLREAELKLPAQTKVFLITGESLQALQGKRPVIHLDLQWITLPKADTTNFWLADAFLDKKDSLHITFGLSKPEGNTYQTILHKKPAKQENVTVPSKFNLTITPVGGNVNLQLASTLQSMNVDTAALHVNIFLEEATKEDARYVETALKAIAAFTKRNININITSIPGQISAHTNWLFWLSTQPLPASWTDKIKSGMNVWQYTAVENFKAKDTWITLPFATENNIPLYRLSTAQPTGIPIWKDGFGHAVLTQMQSKDGRIYQFYSRFHPQWNDLVWHKEFAPAILDILRATVWSRQTHLDKMYDQRIISPQQLMPEQKKGAEKQKDNYKVFSLYEPLWLLVMLLFVLERWLSGRNRPEKDRNKREPVQKEMAS